MKKKRIESYRYPGGSLPVLPDSAGRLLARGCFAPSVGSIGGGGESATRAAADSHADDYDKREFVANDTIRITDGTKTADYQRMVTGTTGTWQPVSGQTALTTTGSETFTASYPTAFTQILTDQSTATNFWKSNKLTATGYSMAIRLRSRSLRKRRR